MASDPSNSLMALLRASGLGQDRSAVEELVTIGRNLEQLRSIHDAVQQTVMLAAPMSSGSAGGRGGVLDTAGSALGGGLGLSPLISGLFGLFGGGDSVSGPPPVVPFARPAPVHVNAGFSDMAGGAAFAVDAAQGNSPRAVTSAAPQITIQVQAMDSRSFMDRSQDIALAVRQAMLETSVLNDVIREV